VATVSELWAEKILDRIHQYWGFYPTTDNPNTFPLPSWFNFYGQIFFYRFPHFIAHLKICQGIRPNDLELLWWKYTLSFGAKCSPTHDGWRKAYFMVKAYRWNTDMLPELAPIVSGWEKILRLKYPRGIGAVRGDYFEDWTHPAAVFALDNFGRVA